MESKSFKGSKVDAMDFDDFDDFWAVVEAFANQYNLSIAFVEEEFIIDSVLYPVHLTFEHEDR